MPSARAHAALGADRPPLHAASSSQLLREPWRVRVHKYAENDFFLAMLSPLSVWKILFYEKGPGGQGDVTVSRDLTLVSGTRFRPPATPGQARPGSGGLKRIGEVG